MIFYTLDYVIEKVKTQRKTAEQMFLRKFTGEDFADADARFLFEKINDHKWFVSERLKRDIGLNVAAVDYFENFHEPKTQAGRKGGFLSTGMKAYENLSLSA